MRRTREADEVIRQTAEILDRLKGIVEDLDRQYKDLDARVSAVESGLTDLYLLVSADVVRKKIEGCDRTIAAIKNLKPLLLCS